MMPIEIKELRIKVNVSDENTDNNASHKKVEAIKLQQLKAEIVNECVLKVLEKIKEKSER